MATVTLAQEHNSYIVYNRQVRKTNPVQYVKKSCSTDSGWENPFRPGGDLSREADEIVELIKEGKPITPTPGSVSPKPSDATASPVDAPDAVVTNGGTRSPPGVQNESPVKKSVANDVGHSPKKTETNQTQKNVNGNSSQPVGPVEVQRGTTVQPSDASQVEHVIIKKKPKCKCCVIQ